MGEESDLSSVFRFPSQLNHAALSISAWGANPVKLRWRSVAKRRVAAFAIGEYSPKDTHHILLILFEYVWH